LELKNNKSFSNHTKSQAAKSKNIQIQYTEQDFFLMELYHRLEIGQKIYYVISHSFPVIIDTNDPVSDASNIFDEEARYGDKDVEIAFSDDEKEAKYIKGAGKRTLPANSCLITLNYDKPKRPRRNRRAKK